MTHKRIHIINKDMHITVTFTILQTGLEKEIWNILHFSFSFASNRISLLCIRSHSYLTKLIVQAEKNLTDGAHPGGQTESWHDMSRAFWCFFFFFALPPLSVVSILPEGEWEALTTLMWTASFSHLQTAVKNERMLIKTSLWSRKISAYENVSEESSLQFDVWYHHDANAITRWQQAPSTNQSAPPNCPHPAYPSHNISAYYQRKKTIYHSLVRQEVPWVRCLHHHPVKETESGLGEDEISWYKPSMERWKRQVRKWVFFSSIVTSAYRKKMQSQHKHISSTR